MKKRERESEKYILYMSFFCCRQAFFSRPYNLRLWSPGNLSIADFFYYLESVNTGSKVVICLVGFVDCKHKYTPSRIVREESGTGPIRCFFCFSFGQSSPDAAVNKAKETTLERTDFALQLSRFGTAAKERDMFIIFFLSSFCQLLSPRF